MKHRSVTRVVAATSLTCLLFAFAMPALAAPGGEVTAHGLWSPVPLFQWLESVWTGWFGTEGDGEGSGIENVYGQIRGVLEPDGAAETSSPTPTSPADSGSTVDSEL